MIQVNLIMSIYDTFLPHRNKLGKEEMKISTLDSSVDKS